MNYQQYWKIENNVEKYMNYYQMIINIIWYYQIILLNKQNYYVILFLVYGNFILIANPSKIEYNSLIVNKKVIMKKKENFL